MKHGTLWCALTIAACFLLSVPSWGAVGEPLPSPPRGANAVVELRALIHSGRFADALTLLRPLVEEDAIEANALFLYWTLLTKVETSCDRILIAGGANVEAEWEQGPAA